MTSIVTYEQMKFYYNQYMQENSQKNKKTVSERDTFNRYAQELNLLGPLIQCARTKGTKKELEQFIQRQNILVKLLKDMGFEVKLMDN